MVVKVFWIVAPVSMAPPPPPHLKIVAAAGVHGRQNDSGGLWRLWRIEVETAAGLSDFTCLE